MPLLVDEIGMVIAGHGRLLAARELGFSALPTIDGSYLTAQERRAYMIADNQIALTAGWDLDMLSSEIGVSVRRPPPRASVSPSRRLIRDAGSRPFQ